MSQILLVCTKNSMTENLRLLLNQEHFVTVIRDVLTIKEYLNQADLIVADVTVPKMANLEVVRSILKNGMENSLILFSEIDESDNILYAEFIEKEVAINKIRLQQLPSKLRKILVHRN